MALPIGPVLADDGSATLPGATPMELSISTTAPVDFM
jgi:hypothetical protein